MLPCGELRIAVERAHDGIAGDDAVGERPAAMRTAVIRCEKPVPQIENRDVPAGESWAFREYRTMAEVIAQEKSLTA